MTSKPIAMLVVGILGMFSLSGLWMTYALVRLLLTALVEGKPVEAAVLAIVVGLIASISGLSGTAIGFIGGMLVQTEKALVQQPTKTEIVNSSENPVQTEAVREGDQP